MVNWIALSIGGLILGLFLTWLIFWYVRKYREGFVDGAPQDGPGSPGYPGRFDGPEEYDPNDD